MKLKKVSSKVLALVMVFAMLFTLSAPVFAEGIVYHSHEEIHEDIHYVSIGDSMTNGYGFEGYRQGDITAEQFFAGEGVYGQGSYALQFEAYLDSI